MVLFTCLSSQLRSRLKEIAIAIDAWVSHDSLLTGEASFTAGFARWNWNDRNDCVDHLVVRPLLCIPGHESPQLDIAISPRLRVLVSRCIFITCTTTGNRGDADDPDGGQRSKNCMVMNVSRSHPCPIDRKAEAHIHENCRARRNTVTIRWFNKFLNPDDWTVGWAWLFDCIRYILKRCRFGTSSKRIFIPQKSTIMLSRSVLLVSLAMRKFILSSYSSVKWNPRFKPISQMKLTPERWWLEGVRFCDWKMFS
jgi:hypothetical protein